MTSFLRNALLGIGLLAVIGILYIALFSGEEESLLTSRVVSDGGASQEAAQFLTRLQALQQVELNRDIFSDPRFTSLRNFRRELADEPTGRTNPFAPAGQ